MKASGHYRPALDGLRGIAIILVLLHHYGVIHAMPIAWYESLFFGLCHSGWIAVDLFFALSGFLITSILLRTKSRRGYFVNFYARRTLRIFPLYYGTLLLFMYGLPTWLAVPLPEPERRIWFWLYVVNLDIALGDWPGRTMAHFWSLCVEEQFYLIWPFVVKAFSKNGLLVLGAFIMVAVSVGRYVAWENGVNGLQMYVLTPFRFDPIVGGAMGAVLMDQYGYRKLRPWALAIVFVLGLRLCYRAYTYGPLINIEWPNAWNTLVYSELAVFFSALVTLAGGAPRNSLIERVLAPTWLTTFGKYSYGIYVLHLAVEHHWFIRFPGWVLPGRDARNFPSMLISIFERSFASLVVAYLSYHLYEQWFLRLKDLFDYALSPPAKKPPESTPRDASPAVAA